MFDRREASDCTSRVVFPELRLSRSLPAFQRTTLEFVPDHSGQFEFACGMNMVHGTLLVESGEHDGTVASDRLGERAADGRAVATAVGVGTDAPGRAARRDGVALRGGGVTCPSCATGIEESLAQLRGVDRVDVNFGTERVTVAYDPGQVDPARIEQDDPRRRLRVERRQAPGSAETEDHEAEERRAEIADLTDAGCWSARC